MVGGIPFGEVLELQNVTPRFVSHLEGQAYDLRASWVVQGDCRAVLADLPPASVDLIFADPPYYLQLQKELRRPNDTVVEGVDDQWDQFASFEDYDRFTRDWLAG